jgi:hypothetical protein
MDYSARVRLALPLMAHRCQNVGAADGAPNACGEALDLLPSAVEFVSAGTRTTPAKICSLMNAFRTLAHIRRPKWRRVLWLAHLRLCTDGL